MNWRDQIHSDPAVLVGKPVVRGTRISVELILELMAAGWTEDKILEGYPRLTREGIRAAVQFAADMVTEERDLASKRAA